MASADVSKVSVYDPRIVSTPAKYKVQLGAQTINNTTFNAQTYSSASQQFNILVPSENVYVARDVDWSSSGVAAINITVTPASGSTVVGGTPIMVLGQDIALAALPSHQCVNVMQATINDQSISVNTADVLTMVLKLADFADHRRQKTAPCKLDTWGIVPDASQVLAGPTDAYNDAVNAEDQPNGAYPQFWFCDSTGAALNSGAIATVASYGGSTQYSAAYGQPVIPAAGITAATTYQLFVKWQTTEKLLLPPFIFGDAFGATEAGLFGIQNFQVQMTMQPTPTRALRMSSAYPNKTLPAFWTVSPSTPAAGATLTYGAWSWATGPTAAPYAYVPALSVQFLTPPASVPLPPKNIVPYMEFPRLITSSLPSIASTLGVASSSAKWTGGTGTSIQSNTFTLNSIPDLLMLYLKPPTYNTTVFSSTPYTLGPTSWDSTIGDFTLPIQNIQMSWDNFGGLLTNATQFQLYKMSIENGLNMSFAEWCGEGRYFTTKFGGLGTVPLISIASLATPSLASLASGTLNVAWAAATLATATGTNTVPLYIQVPSMGQVNAAFAELTSALNGGTASASATPFCSLAGGPLVLRPGVDFPLQLGQASGLVGNFSLQVTLQVGNQFSQTISASGVNLYIVPINSGFFETVKGTSRIVRGVLTEQDILSAGVSAPSDALDRLVGEGGGARPRRGKGGKKHIRLSEYV